MLVNKTLMNVENGSFHWLDAAVREWLVAEIFRHYIKSRLNIPAVLFLQLQNVDIIQIVEVLTIETAEDQHAAAYKARAVSTSRFR